MIFCWDVIFEPVNQDDEGQEMIQHRKFQYDQKSEVYFPWSKRHHARKWV